jgi:hypothetical protein
LYCEDFADLSPAAAKLSPSFVRDNKAFRRAHGPEWQSLLCASRRGRPAS